MTLAYSPLTRLASSWSSQRSGRADLGLELDEAGPAFVDLEIAVGLVEPSSQAFQVVGEITHEITSLPGALP